MFIYDDVHWNSNGPAIGGRFGAPGSDDARRLVKRHGGTHGETFAGTHHGTGSISSRDSDDCARRPSACGPGMHRVGGTDAIRIACATGEQQRKDYESGESDWGRGELHDFRRMNSAARLHAAEARTARPRRNEYFVKVVSRHKKARLRAAKGTGADLVAGAAPLREGPEEGEQRDDQ